MIDNERFVSLLYLLGWPGDFRSMRAFADIVLDRASKHATSAEAQEEVIAGITAAVLAIAEKSGKWHPNLAAEDIAAVTARLQSFRYHGPIIDEAIT